MLHVSQSLGQGKSILLVSFDHESGLYVPVGLGYSKDGGAEIRVESVPKPAGTDERDVKGALLMLAYKLLPEKIAKAVGFEDPYPLLRVATVGEDGLTRYEERGEAYVRDQVSKAQRILLFVHGFTGDTRGMIASTRFLHKYAPDLPQYDLILAFDYENINTRIQDTAAKLRERLENVGLGARHGKTLDIVAHSLGTQVCRWFIERDGGNKIASKLVMMGPPNAGTPLTVLQDWATYLIGLGLNGLLALVNPPAAIVQLAGFASAVVAGVEKVDTTLDQLKLDSEFYKDLNRSPDPNIAYQVVIGNTKEIKYAALSQGEPTNAFRQAVRRLFSPQVAHHILSVAFANQANDMAISVASAESVALLRPDRDPRPEVTVVDCDHITYFNTDVGLKALAKALAMEESTDQ